MKGPALVVMARAPMPGQVKTRLQPDLTPEQCAAVYEAFLRDTLNLAVSLSQYTCFLAFTPSEACIFFEGFTQREIILLPQTGNNLGQRIYHLMHLLENMEYSPVVLIGSDIPTLQPGILQQAIEELRTFDLCLGPSQDGGYYLVGSRHADKRIFCGIPWSTPDVLKITIRKAKEAELSLALLEECIDVDTFEDLKKLSVIIKELRRVSETMIPLHTEAWLRKSGLFL